MSRALTRRRDQIDAALAQLGVPNLLHHEVASEPAGGLNEDGADAVPSATTITSAPGGGGRAPFTRRDGGPERRGKGVRTPSTLSPYLPARARKAKRRKILKL